mmetsp:Transcript_72141/g.204821  ORF Transcript_72141/g.204821 Transcript_72141/m.204821 type:complete len:241 (+) Transcript_72141:792-1514(+)
MDEKPRAIHFLRRSSTVRTGLAASIAVWNSFMEIDPFLSESRKSKMVSWSSRERPPKCLFKKRLNSFLDSSLVPPPAAAAKWSKAVFIVANLSRIFCRNCMSRIAAPRFRTVSARLVASGVASRPPAADVQLEPVSVRPVLMRFRAFAPAGFSGSSGSWQEPYDGLRGKILSSTLAVQSSMGNIASAFFSITHSFLRGSSAESGRLRPSRFVLKKVPLPDGRVCRPLSLHTRLSPPVDCQ